jgi:hypothetical protein
MTANFAKVPVSMRALTQRLNHRLAHDGKQLRAPRGAGKPGRCDYFIVSKVKKAVVARHIDPEVLGRELGVLQAWEVLDDA